MTRSQTYLEKEIREAIPLLLDLARKSCRNTITENCRFLLTEIDHTSVSISGERQRIKKINDRKIPEELATVLSRLEEINADLYDINLYVYKACKKQTLIDIRYIRKNALNDEYRQTIQEQPPMIHCKIARPPWLNSFTEKFDINWEHREWLISWNLFKARFKQKLRMN